MALDYAANTYLAVSLAPSSPYMTNPSALGTVHPAVSHAGQVGALDDVQLLAVPKAQWEGVKGDVMDSLNGKDGILRIDVQELKARAKRDEL